jgi:GAF domain-containing protein
MKTAEIPTNELERLQSLNEHELLDTLPEDLYDDITRIATDLTGTPTSLITLVDKDRLWFKSKQGLDDLDVPRELSFSAHAILSSDEVFVVPDARNDERFFDNPYTTGISHIVFYAGVPIKDSKGNALGTLCVIDSRPREFTDQQLEALKALANLIKAYFELRKTKIDLEKAQEDSKMVRSIVDTIRDDITDLLKNNPNPEQVHQLTTALQITIDAGKNVNPDSK